MDDRAPHQERDEIRKVKSADMAMYLRARHLHHDMGQSRNEISYHRRNHFGRISGK